jgi:para-aminobenzoate synthetase component 1
MLYHIQQGDLYEANFCMEFYAENAIIDPLDKFQTQRNFSTSICCFF